MASTSASTDPVKPGSETQYALASAVGEDGKQQKQPKLGHNCCGRCCDMRRAVIVVNIVNLVLVAMGLFSVLAARAASANADQVDDDELSSALEEFRSLPLGAFLAIQITKIVLSVVGIVGAVKFHQIMVGLSMAAYAFDAVAALIGLNVVGLLYAGFFAYPHGFFIKEVRDGIMTKENYPNEEFSCCCV